MSFLRVKRHLSNKRRGQEGEKRCAKFSGGRLQPASGALPSVFKKGDVLCKKFLIDTKTTQAKSYSVGVKLWQKLANEAWMNQKSPMLRIEFSGNGPTVYVIDEFCAQELFNGITI